MIILFRKDQQTEEEFKIALTYSAVFESRMDIPSSSTIIGRYSVLPYYNELERDLEKKNSRLINSFKEHCYIANMEYIDDIITPKTYFKLEDIKDKTGSFVLKGRTNSRKHQWKEKMFAGTFEDAVRIYVELMNDPLIGSQGVVIREYVPLKNFGISLNGMPFANEWRLFFYKDELLSYGYYWSNAEYIPKKEDLPKEALDFAKKMAKNVKASFFVMDIAETEKEDWTVIELNDGQMSGLSMVEPSELYKSLKGVIDG